MSNYMSLPHNSCSATVSQFVKIRNQNVSLSRREAGGMEYGSMGLGGRNMRLRDPLQSNELRGLLATLYWEKPFLHLSFKYARSTIVVVPGNDT